MEERNMIKEKNEYKKWEKKIISWGLTYATVINILQNWEKEFRLVKFYTDYQTIDGIKLTL